MFENNKNIWVYIETEEGKPKAVGFELLSPGRDIADKRGCSLVAVVIGNGVEETGKTGHRIWRRPGFAAGCTRVQHL